MCHIASATTATVAAIITALASPAARADAPRRGYADLPPIAAPPEHTSPPARGYVPPTPSYTPPPVGAYVPPGYLAPSPYAFAPPPPPVMYGPPPGTTSFFAGPQAFAWPGVSQPVECRVYAGGLVHCGTADMYRNPWHPGR